MSYFFPEELYSLNKQSSQSFPRAEALLQSLRTSSKTLQLDPPKTITHEV